ncbi:radical SAM protein [Candidatus Dependentiae bacterium]|nr:radical SAM protein [Candidatus Dependentiae bacterium]
MIILINPNLVFQKNDPFTTGVVYMPVGLAYAAAVLNKSGFPIRVIDAFGENPGQLERSGKFNILGLTYEEILFKIPEDSKIIYVYAINLLNHISTVSIIENIKLKYPDKIVIVIENTQAVTAYALKKVYKEFLAAGADYVLTGECEFSIVELTNFLLSSCNNENFKKINGLCGKDFFNENYNVIENPDSLPFPAWEFFPVENYWKLKFGHGPVSLKKYMPILTSRGCPYKCRFCVSPENNFGKWRSRSEKNIVDEIEKYVNEFGVEEFHIEDLNPTVSDERIQNICKEILRRNLKIIWKIAAGTKVETIKSEETVRLMAESGCRYISISPETGSPDVLKKMNKPFDIDHAVKNIRFFKKYKIFVQTCFVLGFPGETKQDLIKTYELIKSLTKFGIDEIALFIIAPVPGSSIFEEFKGYLSLSDLNFTPSWRSDYEFLVKFRMKLYRMFLIIKLIYHPLKVIKQSINFFKRSFDTKMEMVPYRALIYKYYEFRSRFKK